MERRPLSYYAPPRAHEVTARFFSRRWLMAAAVICATSIGLFALLFIGLATGRAALAGAVALAQVVMLFGTLILSLYLYWEMGQTLPNGRELAVAWLVVGAGSLCVISWLLVPLMAAAW